MWRNFSSSFTKLKSIAKASYMAIPGINTGPDYPEAWLSEGEW